MNARPFLLGFEGRLIVIEDALEMALKSLTKLAGSAIRIAIPLGIALSLSLTACAPKTSSEPTSEPESTASPTADAEPTSTADTTTPAQSTSIEGEYAIQGTNPDGSSYEGSLSITSLGEDKYELKWSAGNDYQGIGFLRGETLAVGWGSASCTVAAYDVQSDGSLQGEWALVGQPAVGAETATPAQAASDGKIDGDYTVTGKNLQGKEYKGTLTITPHDKVYQFSWDVGAAFEGIGLQNGQEIVVGWSTTPDEECGVVAYQVTDGKLEGDWGVYGTNETGTEVATKK